MSKGAMNVRINFGALKKFKNKMLKELGGKGDTLDGRELIEDVLRTAGQRCLSRTEKRTPVDTGQLRKNWEAGKTVKRGWNYTINIENPVEYATYVEYGHRPNWQGMVRGKKNKQGTPKLELNANITMEDGTPAQHWVQGYFMLTKSIDETREDMPKLVEEKIEKKLREIMQ